MPITAKSTAAVIADLRERAGLTAKELAERANLSPALISRIENDEYKTLSLSTAKSLAEGLDLPLSTLLQELGLLENAGRPSFMLIERALRSNGYSGKETEDIIKFARYVKKLRLNQ